jgi:putative membrane protein
MSALRRMITTGGTLAVTLMATPMIVLQAQATKQAPPDLPFIREAASANLKEVRLGQLAQSKSSNPAVKEYGLRMVTDHNRLEQDLISMVSRNGIALKPALTPDHVQQIHGLLVGPSGEPFDQAYMTMMIQDHQTDVARFESESRDANSPEVRDFAARSLPVLQQHLSLAQQVGRQVNVEVATTPLPPSKVPVPLPPSKVPPTQNRPVTNPSTQQAQSSEADVRADSRFIYEGAVDDLLETSMASLAQKKAESSAVKQLAERMDADHNRMQSDWLGVAERNGLQFKVGMGKNHRAKLDRLKKLSGRAFDRAYIKTVVQNHKDYIDYFEKEGRSAHSTQVRELVERQLPTLRSHFIQAKQVGGQGGAATAATSRSERRSCKI